MKFKCFLFACASNQRCISVHEEGGRTEFIVCDYNGFRLTEYHRPQMNSEDAGQWLADTLGDAIFKESSEQLDAVIEALSK